MPLALMVVLASSGSGVRVDGISRSRLTLWLVMGKKGVWWSISVELSGVEYVPRANL